MANKRLYQILVARESQPGVLASGLVAAANAKLQIKDPLFTFNVEQYEREILRGNLSPLQTISGKVDCDVSFAVELAGSTTASDAPPWGVLLEACGMQQKALYGGSWSGVFTGSAAGEDKVIWHGREMQNAAGTNVVVAVHDTYESSASSADSRLFYCTNKTGALALEAYYPVGGSLAVGPVITITAGQPANQKGYVWQPVSVPKVEFLVGAVTGTIAAGDVLKGGTSGCVLQAVTAVTSSARFEFYDLDGTPPVAGETLTNITTGASGSVPIDGAPAFAQTDFPTISIALIENGRIKTAKGCRGTFSMSAERGKPMFLNFQFKGLLASDPGNQGTLTGVAYESKVPPKFQGIGFTVGSYSSGEPGYWKYTTTHTPRINSLSLDLGGTANIGEDATQDNGTFGAAQITAARNAQGSMKVDVRPEASFPFGKKFKGSEAFRLKLRLQNTGNVANNAFIVSSPGCVITGMSGTDTNGFGQDDISFSLSARLPNGADGEGRELVLTYHFATTAGA